jgi:replicative DNA helicase
MAMFMTEPRRDVALGDPASQPVAGRVPPHDLDAEAAVLSAVLLSAEAFDLAQEVVEPQHFYSDAHRRIYEAAFELRAADKPVDIVTVATWLRDRSRLAQVGGTPYLAQLVDATPSVANVQAHATTIQEKWRVRQLIQMCQRYAAEAYSDYGDVQGFIDGAEQSIFEIARIPSGSAVRPVESAIKEVFGVITEVARRGGGITGTQTGFTRLDQLSGGLRGGDLYIVAARPGMGKTAFVLNMAVNVASIEQFVARPAPDRGDDSAGESLGHGVLFFSLEMPREQLASRLLATEARIDLSLIRTGKLGTPEWTKLTEAAARLTRLPLWLDDTPGLTLMDLRAKVRRLQAELQRGGGPARQLGLVVVDYLQLMQGRRDAGSREQEISELSRGLKRLAKEMDVPIIALSQLNRSVETRTSKDKRPQLSDLRESGAIEQDADMVMFLYRPDYYRGPGGADGEDLDESQRGIAEVIIAKQRNGPTDTFKVRFTKACTRFDNLDPGQFEEYDDFPDDGGAGYGLPDV